MDELQKYNEDEKFVRWVLNPNEQLNSYWEKFRKNNPMEKEQIDLAQALILQFKCKKEDISEEETNSLFSEIMKGIEDQQSRKKVRRITRPILKYAAVVIFFILIGVGFYSYLKLSDFGLNAQKLLSHAQEETTNSRLILFNGKNIILSERNSFIEQVSQEQVVINKKDTIFLQETNNPGLNQLIVPRGKNSTIKFSDGTIVHLNSGSHLVYPAVFNENKRQAYLRGEGFFEVAHNPNMPFVVSTRNIEVEDLGTKFNLSAYPFDAVVETFLLEGKVKVTETGRKLGKTEQVLNPLQKAVFDKKREDIKVSSVDDMDYVSWYKGYLNFKSRNLLTIIRKLERHFNIEIKLSDPSLGTKIISGKLKLDDEEMDTVVQVLANTASLNVEKLDPSTFILK